MASLTGQIKQEWRTAAALFVVLLACYVYILPRWADPNQNSRLDMVIAVVEDGTFQIDKYVENTVDYAKVGDHYYSDKAPGAAFVGIPVYLLIKQVLDRPIMDGLMTRLASNQALEATLREGGTGLLAHKVRFAIAQVVLTLVTAALPTAAIGALLYRLLSRFAIPAWPRIWVVLGYGLLTPAFAYAGAFYGHQLCTACLFAAFYLVFMARQPMSTGALLAVGFLLGYSVITEYPAVLVAGILFLYALYRLADRRRIGWVILAGAPVAAGWLAYNTALFGTPLALGYSYSELWTEQHHTGFMSLTLPHWSAIWGITFSPFRGLFFYAPWLLAFVPGLVLWFSSREHRAEFWVVLGTMVAMFLFNSSSVMWWGGFAVGPRYLLPMLPFMALPIALAWTRWQARTWFKLGIAVLCGWSLIATWGLALAGQAFPSDTLHSPLVQYAWPNWQSGNVARNLGMFLRLPGIYSLLPLGMGVAVWLVVLWILTHSRRAVVHRLGGI
jgi:hypothetical protein